MPSEVLRELIIELSEPDRLEIIREAGISDERPAGMPSLIPRNSRPNWKTPIASPYPTTSGHGMRGRLITSTSGTAAKKKRSAASATSSSSPKPP